MSSNTNWKIIGANSGNMSRHRNVKAGKLNYEDGKWKSVYDTDGNKKIVHDLSDNLTNQNVVIGIGTSNPFSRLSLGSNPGDGTIGNETTIGQIAAIALHEASNGTKFHGLSYVADVSRNQQTVPPTNVDALALYSNTSNENISLSAAKTYITDDGVVRICGMPRTGPAISSAGDFVAYPKIALDISGSIQIDGFISFCDLGAASGTDNIANSSGEGGLAGTRKIPYGAIWVGKRSVATGQPVLYMQGQGQTRVELASISQVTAASTTAWDFSDNIIAGKYIFNAIPTAGDLQASNVTITGAQHNTFQTSDAAFEKFGRNFINALSIRGGNMSISSVDTFAIMGGSDEISGLGAHEKPITAGYTPQQLGLSGETTDVSSGVLFIEKQLLIGMGNDWIGTTYIDDISGFTAKALIDISGGTPYPIPAIMIGHGLPQRPYSEWGGEEIPRATNSIIVGDIKTAIIGNVDIGGDVKNSFIIGEDNTVHTGYTSIIVGNTNKIADSSGNLLVLGQDNGLTTAIKATNSIIVGYKNNVTSKFDQYSVTTKGGNIVFGEENTYTSEDTSIIGNNNVIFGYKNNINATEYSFIQGKNNRTYGQELTVIGDGNKVGTDSLAPAADTNSNYKVEHSFVHGFQNEVFGPTGSNSLKNVYAFGYKNKIDMSSNLTLDEGEAFILLGSYADISGTVGDTSNVKFAFGSHNMWTARGGNTSVNGNVFTIDHSGNTHIYGNLIVDGSQVILRTEYFDVSDNNITLNSEGNDPSGGGFTILDSGGSGDPHVFKWVGSPGTDGSFNTGTADLSTNNMFIGPYWIGFRSTRSSSRHPSSNR